MLKKRLLLLDPVILTCGAVLFETLPLFAGPSFEARSNDKAGVSIEIKPKPMEPGATVWEFDVTMNTHAIGTMQAVWDIIISPISADACLCVPLWNNPICIATKEKYDLFHIDWEKINPVTGNIQPFAVVNKNGADVYLYPYQSDTLLKLNLDTREISYQRLQISIQDYVSFINNVMDVRNFCYKDGLLYEVNLPLEMYLQWIANSEAKTENSCENKGQAGKMIYDIVVQAIN
jgi:hypothetical protein